MERVTGVSWMACDTSRLRLVSHCSSVGAEVLKSPEVSSGERVYRGSVRALSLAFLVIGLVVVVRTLVGGGGPLSVGFLLGLAFVAVGVGRLWIASRT